MKNNEKGIYDTGKIVEILSESLAEIDNQFKKVQQLKKLFENAPRDRTPPSKPQLSYAARYKKPEKKPTNSLSYFPDQILSNLKRSLSKPSLQESTKDTYNFEKNETADENLKFADMKEKEVRSKVESAKVKENKILEIEKSIKRKNISLKTLEESTTFTKKNLESQIKNNLCRNIVYDIILCIENQGIQKKINALMSNKPKVTEKLIKMNSIIQEITKTKSILQLESKEYIKNSKKIHQKDEELTKLTQKISKNTKTIQNSKHNQPLKLKDDELKLKEQECLQKLKQLNQKKCEIELKHQKNEKPAQIKKSSSTSCIKNLSIKDQNILNKEKALNELEAKIIQEEQEIELKKNKIIEKWEKMIVKVDDINKKEHKTSYTNQELEDKYKEFNIYKKDIEMKFDTQQAALDNQDCILNKKIKNLQEKFYFLQRKELDLEQNKELTNKNNVILQSTPVEDLQEHLEPESTDEDFVSKFIERQNLRKKELELISKEKQALSSTLTGFFSELN